MHHKSSYITIDFHNLGGKPINVWIVDCAVVKISEIFNMGGATAKWRFSGIPRRAMHGKVLLQNNGADGKCTVRMCTLGS